LSSNQDKPPEVGKYQPSLGDCLSCDIVLNHSLDDEILHDVQLRRMPYTPQESVAFSEQFCYRPWRIKLKIRKRKRLIW